MTTSSVRHAQRRSVFALALTAAAMSSTAAIAGVMPEIRTSSQNRVPACVTPDRLMAFLKTRNTSLNARFNDIARHYQSFGEAWRVRWDYAFFQMAVETNFLTYRQPNGRMGDVDPAQNNFAGIGTTGGGVPGDRFPDVKTGVHAQIQHLVVYSGERLAAPIAPRTQLKQDDIIDASLALARPVRFNDLARRWAVDRNYDKSIEWVAGLYRSRYCNGREADLKPALATPAAATAAGALSAPRPTQRAQTSPPTAGTPTGHPAVRTIWVRSPRGTPLPDTMRAGAASPRPIAQPAKAQSAPVAPALAAPATENAAMIPAAAAAVAPPAPPAASTAPEPSRAPGPVAQAEPSRPPFDPAKTPPSGLGAPGLTCSVGTASYGGSKSVLIKLRDGEQVRYTVLTVLEGFESSMTESYIKARAPGGSAIGEFGSRESALETARALCPTDKG